MNKPSRRAVVRTGVWAVPAVATVAAAPAFASESNQPPPITISSTGDVCKLPGDGQHTKDYRFTLYFTNTTNTELCFVLGSFQFKDQTKAPSPDNGCVPANTSNYPLQFTLFDYNDSSSNPTATIPYTIVGHEGDFQQPVTFATPIHPCADH
jgi:hypothetical protein